MPDRQSSDWNMGGANTNAPKWQGQCPEAELEGAADPSAMFSELTVAAAGGRSWRRGRSQVETRKVFKRPSAKALQVMGLRSDATARETFKGQIQGSGQQAPSRRQGRRRSNRGSPA